MNYRVVVSARAQLGLFEDAVWWAEHRSEEQAIRWLEGFEAALERLSRAPLKHPLAPESGEFPFEIRQILYGIGRRPTHRAVFEVREDTVIVHCIRHLATEDHAR